MATEGNYKPNENCCRTCMKEDSSMFDLFIERLGSSNIADMLNSCTELQIKKGDSLPKQICRYCYNCIVSFSDFCNTAQKTQEKFRQTTLNNEENNHNVNQCELVEIKIEYDDNDIEMPEDMYQMKEEVHDINNYQSSDSNKLQYNNCNYAEVKEISEQALTCVYCDKTFTKLYTLKCHQETHLNLDHCSTLCDKKNKNDNANPFSINNESQAVSKMKTNNDSKVICVICSSKFKSKNSLSAHMKKHVEKGRVISCNICGKNFKKLSHLKRHYPIHQKTHLLQDNLTIKENLDTNTCESSPLDQKVQCDICLLTFKNINSLSAHMKKHTEKDRVISCKECNKVFKKLSHLKRHEIRHEINRPFKCSICPKTFPNEENLKDHINKHKGVKPYACPICGKKFSHLSTVANHIKVHTRDKTFLCPTCGKKFGSSTNLKQHMLRHIGLKQFACTLCPKKFVSKGALKSHTVTHTGERPYACEQCGATFAMRYALNKHARRHLGIKPHHCDTCTMRFSCKSHLIRHQRIHTGEKPYKCDMCEKAFTQSNDLTKHRRAHVGDELYKCDQCTEGFRFQLELRQHISEHFISSRSEQEVKNILDDVDSKDYNITNAQTCTTDSVSRNNNKKNNPSEIESSILQT